MVEWKTVAAISGFLALVGVSFDRFLLKRQKGFLYLALLTWWDQLDETSIPDYPWLMTRWILDTGRRLFRWRNFSWQSVGLCLVLSWILTSSAALLGRDLDGGYAHTSRLLPWFGLYFINAFFDISTVLITVHILRMILRTRSRVVALLLIAVDIALAVTLAICCLALILWNGDNRLESIRSTEESVGFALDGEIQWPQTADRYPAERSIGFYLKHSPSVLLEAFGGIRPRIEYSWVEEGGTWMPDPAKKISFEYSLAVRWYSVCASLTVLLPTIMYMIMLASMIIGRSLLELTRRVVMHVLEAVTEHDPSMEPKEFMPGTMMSVLFVVIGSIANLVAKMIP